MRRLKPFQPSGLTTGVAGHNASVAGEADLLPARGLSGRARSVELPVKK
jgi:hypothetical protein